MYTTPLILAPAERWGPFRPPVVCFIPIYLYICIPNILKEEWTPTTTDTYSAKIIQN